MVDTPPIFEAKAHNQEMYRDIGDCYLLSAPGPHVLLLVTQLGRFTAQDTVAVRRVKEVFGAEAISHVVILFTHKEDLEGDSLVEYLANTDNHSLRSLVQECEKRYCAFNNRVSGNEQREQLAELMAVVEGLEREHAGAFHRNNLFSEAEMFQRGGRDTQGEGYKRYLAAVQLHVEKQKRQLNETWAFRVLRRVQKWMTSNIGLSAFLVICLLIFLSVLINLCIAHGH